MGIMNHNAVLATCELEDPIKRMKAWIKKRGLRNHFMISEPQINGNVTFCLIPDGSKENWEGSKQGDEKRKLFIEKLKQEVYADGSSSWSWIEVGYGEYGSKILDTNCANCYNDKEYALDETGEL
jgi:hypothetical protein